MKFHYDKKQDAFYLRFNNNPYLESDEVQEGIIFDYDARGKIIAIEILNASRRLPRQFQTEMQQNKIPLSLAMEKTM